MGFLRQFWNNLGSTIAWLFHFSTINFQLNTRHICWIRIFSHFPFRRSSSRKIIPLRPFLAPSARERQLFYPKYTHARAETGIYIIYIYSRVVCFSEMFIGPHSTGAFCTLCWCPRGVDLLSLSLSGPRENFDAAPLKIAHGPERAADRRLTL